MNAQTPIVAAIAALACSSAGAQDFYVGMEGARERLTFKPDYYTLAGEPDNQFANRARGQAGGILAGIRWQSGTRAAISIEGRLSASNTDWTLRLPDEPASFRYAIPYSAAVVVQPSLRLSDRVSVYAEAGLVAGRIQERKSAPNTSRYDERRWRSGTVLGAGIEIRFDSLWSARAGIRKTRFDTLSYTSHLPDGTPAERIRDRPEQHVTHIGLIRRF